MSNSRANTHPAQKMYSTEPITNDLYDIRPSFIDLPQSDELETAFRDRATGMIAAKIIAFQKKRRGDDWLPLTHDNLASPELTGHKVSGKDCGADRCNAAGELGNLLTEGWLVQIRGVIYFTPAFIELCYRAVG